MSSVVQKISRKVRCDIKTAADIIMDVERYHEFISFYQKIIIIDKNLEGTAITAISTVILGMFEHKYTSHITMQIKDDGTLIITTLASDGPFKNLTNTWTLTQLTDGVRIDFSIDITLRNPLLHSALRLGMNKITTKIIEVFLKRFSDCGTVGAGVGVLHR